MPLITTHNLFAKEIFNKTKKEITNPFSKKQNIYELFAQGFDPFHFYEFFKCKKYGLLNYCHNNYTDTFFLHFIQIIKRDHLQENPSILAALYGHLTHYILDSTCHPYIIYKTGEYDKNKPETRKYNGCHSQMEMQIDAYFYEQKYHKKFKNFKMHRELITKDRLNKDLINVLNEVYLSSLNIIKGGDKYQKGCINMYYTYKYLIEDKTGIKTFFYKIFDKCTPKKQGVYAHYSAHIKRIDPKIFNMEHKIWVNPWDKKIQSHESFFDLYHKALNECLTLFEATHAFLKNKITESEYKNILKDKSYTTGFSWKQKSEIKYLEF